MSTNLCKSSLSNCYNVFGVFRTKAVIHDLIKRYVMKRQRTSNAVGVSEDDINEIKQDISSFRYELLEILRSNGMATATAATPVPHPQAQSSW